MVNIKPLYTLIATVGLTVVLLLLLVSTWFGHSAQPLEVSTTQNSNLLPLTGDTARLSGNNPLETVTAYSQAIYPAAQDKDRPGAVVLVRDDDQASAMTTTRLQHFPVNAPMLFVTGGGKTLPKETEEELKRLEPEGVLLDHNVQVYIVGNIDKSVEDDVKKLGFKTRGIYASNPLELSEKINEYLAILESNHQEMVMIAPIDNLDYALPASNWNAHNGNAFAFVTRDGVPEETKRILNKTWPNYAYIYVFAPPSVVGDDVMNELSKYGHVQRIPGNTPQEMAVKWAGLKDAGVETAWWFGFQQRSIGWGIAEPGHNLILANPSDWRNVVPSGVLSHMGKHGFLLLTENDGSLPQASKKYLQTLKPTETYPNQQVFNYAWILGQNIKPEAANELTELLKVQK